MSEIASCPRLSQASPVGSIRVELYRKGLPALSDERDYKIVEPPPPKESGKKINISYPGGIEVSCEEGVILPRTEDPAVILGTIGVPCGPSEASTFEGLVTILTSVPGISSELQGYPDYIQAALSNSLTSFDAWRSVDVLSRAMTGKGLRGGGPMSASPALLKLELDAATARGAGG